MKLSRGFKLSFLALTLLAGLALAAGTGVAATAKGKAEAAAKSDGKGGAPELWTKRCSGKKDDKERVCEVFQRKIFQETKERAIEFAVGFPTPDKKVARGAFILPLGILLTDDLQMQIDNGKIFKFKVRYCLADGCYAYIDLNSDLLALMAKSADLKVDVKVAPAGQDLTLNIDLAGFGDALKKL